MNDDELRRRLVRADPAVDDHPADSWLEDLVEETMSTPEKSTNWTPIAAAAAVVLIAGAVAFALTRGDDRSDSPPVAKPSVVELTMPEPVATKCAAVTPELLSGMDQALSGTATTVAADQVVLDVDRWYHGGDATRVKLVPPSTGMAVALESVEFEQGRRYLVSASDGRANLCGFSAPYSPELAAAFDEAFPHP